MSYWDILPNDLKYYIFKFDPTWNEVYNNLMKELLYRTPYWRVKFLDAEHDQRGRYENKRQEISFIVDYWNNTYKNYYKENYEKCEDDFLTDSIPNMYNVIMKDLKVLKTFNFIFSNNEIRLIRKNYARADKLADIIERQKFHP
tara:strand:+ start:335 stop:766 length:432 start_codon:yes stop_codon:yes gene_type:complete